MILDQKWSYWDIFQKAYDTALNTVKQFKDLIKALINNPANAIIHGDSGNYKQSGALAGQISLFEHFKVGLFAFDLWLAVH